MDKSHESDLQGQIDALRVAVLALMDKTHQVSEVRGALETHARLFPSAGPGFTHVSDILRGKKP